MPPYAYTLDSKWVFFSFKLFQGNLIFVFVYQKLTLVGFLKKLSFYYKYLEGVELFSTMIGEMFIQELIVPVLAYINGVLLFRPLGHITFHLYRNNTGEKDW